MVAHSLPTANIDYNDPVRKQLIAAKREHAKNQKKDYSHVFSVLMEIFSFNFSPKSRFDLIRLSAIVMAIEFAYAAETAFVSPILLEIGIDHSKMTMIWGISPFVAFFVSPLMGSISDKCRSPLGRRRPFILILSIGIVLGLLFVPYGKVLGILLGDYGDEVASHANDTKIGVHHTPALHPEGSVFESYKWAVMFTIIGTILLDFDCDNCLTPARAYLLDVSLPENHAKALSTSTMMAGAGGCMGYLLGGFNWEATFLGEFFGGNIKTVFAIVTVIFLIGLLVTITSFREIPLPLMDKDEMLRPITQVAINRAKDKVLREGVQGRTTEPVVLTLNDLSTKNKGTQIENNEAGPSNEVHDDDHQVTFGQYLKSIVIMPKSLRLLCLTNFFSWMSHCCYCLYFTDFVGEAVFKGDPKGQIGSPEHQLYEDGIRFGCYGLAIYAAACCLYSMTIEPLISKLGAKAVYVGGLTIFGVGMLVLGCYPTKELTLLLSITGGVIYATLFTFPFLLVARYHEKGSVRKGQEIPSKVKRGLGTDIAIVGSMLFVGQFTVSLSVGYFVTLLGSTTAIMFAASGFAFLAALSALKVVYMGL
uniref:CSON000978 protein n=1 Tax=Culicoides sonorensis TaxID=179676 RepID=A0A336M2T8_CULSO